MNFKHFRHYIRRGGEVRQKKRWMLNKCFYVGEIVLLARGFENVNRRPKLEFKENMKKWVWFYSLHNVGLAESCEYSIARFVSIVFMAIWFEFSKRK